jgi:hypothetical protein
MITLKQVEKDERWAFTVIKKFVHNHPIFLSFAGIITFIVVMLAVNTIMLLAAVGGGMAEQHAHERLVTGEMSVDEYVSLINVLNIAVTLYNFVAICIRLAIGALITIMVYIGFKEYLKYRRDNL